MSSTRAAGAWSARGGAATGSAVSVMLAGGRESTAVSSPPPNAPSESATQNRSRLQVLKSWMPSAVPMLLSGMRHSPNAVVLPGD